MKKLVLLEYYRGIAAFGVAICHYYMFTAKIANAELLSTIFVEMFFPLSGFVLASQTILVAEKKGSIRVFWARRWMRTLPLFVLAVVCAAIILKTVSKTDFLEMLFFVKFFTPSYNDGNFYPVAWSLAVEEWYYLLTPFLFTILPFVAKSRQKILYFTVFLIAVSMALKIVFQIAGTDPQFLRIATYLRLDAITIGFLFFQLNSLTTKNGWITKTMIVSGLIFAGSLWATLNLASNGAVQLLFLTSTSIFFATVISWLYNWEKSSHLPKGKPAMFTGLWFGRLSYSVYLFHLIVLYLISSHKLEVGLLFYLAITTTLAIALYYAIEKPLMDMRPVYKNRAVPNI